MNKIVISISLVVGLYLVSFATAGGHLGNVPVTPDDSVPQHIAPHGDHTGVPMEGTFNCAPSDAHRTDVPLDVPTGAPLLDVPTDAPLAERDKMRDYLDHLAPRAPLTGTFPCDTTGAPANS